MQDLLLKAIIFSTDLHDSQKRKINIVLENIITEKLIDLSDSFNIFYYMKNLWLIVKT